MSQVQTDDIVAVLRAPFADPQWLSKLCLQGAVLLFLSWFLIGTPFLMGFLVRCTQLAINGEKRLPDWSEWGTYGRLGIKLLGILLTYYLPMMVLWLLTLITMLPIIFLASQEETFAIFFVIPAVIGCLALLVTIGTAIGLWFTQPALMALVALERPFKDAFAWKQKLWPYITANMFGIILALATSYLTGFIAGLGIYVFIIGIFITLPYSMVVPAYFYGMIYRQSPVKL